jgi:hypothetical protein
MATLAGQRKVALPVLGRAFARIGSVGLFVIVYGVTLYRWHTSGYIGWDAGHYFDAARRFVETGTPYLASEVAWPFVYGDLTFLHPPVSLYLFVPFAYLPFVLWWVVPIAGIAWLLRDAKAKPLIIAVLCWPTLPIAAANGNTDWWVLMFAIAGVRYGWPALAVIVKASLAPLMLSGVRHRSWWYGLPVLAVACLPFGALWADWVAVVQNSPGDLTYSLSAAVPLTIIPLVARR